MRWFFCSDENLFRFDHCSITTNEYSGMRVCVCMFWVLCSSLSVRKISIHNHASAIWWFYTNQWICDKFIHIIPSPSIWTTITNNAIFRIMVLVWSLLLLFLFQHRTCFPFTKPLYLWWLSLTFRLSDNDYKLATKLILTFLELCIYCQYSYATRMFNFGCRYIGNN